VDVHRRGFLKILSLALLLLAVGASPSPYGLRGAAPQGKPEACDRVVHADCQTGMWTSTDREWCGFSLACTFNLPPFSGHFVEQERETVCRFRCENGYTYTKTYYERRALRIGCCGGGLGGSGNAKESACLGKDSAF